MAELPSMIKDLALILVMAGVVTLIFKKLKQPLVLGYIVAGFLVSPHMPYTASVVDVESIHLWADIGVMFFFSRWDLISLSRKSSGWVLHLLYLLVPSFSVCRCWDWLSEELLAGDRWTAYSLGVCWLCHQRRLSTRLSMIWDYVSSSLPAW